MNKGILLSNALSVVVYVIIIFLPGLFVVGFIISLLNGIKLTDWLLVVFTGILALFTWKLWRSTDKMWIATKKAAEVAEKSAEALPLVERAYLFADIELRKDRFDEWEIVIKLFNEGKTPAIINGVYTDIIMRADCPADIKEDRLIRIIEGTIIKAGDSIEEPIYGTGARKQPTIGRQPLPERFICFGRVDYRDIFQKDTRITRFCFHHDSEAFGEGVYFRRCGIKHNYYT
jgi:glycosyltransferase involved in cell wall biosynthesis